MHSVRRHHVCADDINQWAAPIGEHADQPPIGQVRLPVRTKRRAPGAGTGARMRGSCAIMLSDRADNQLARKGQSVF
jgi:hypothetical protein